MRSTEWTKTHKRFTTTFFDRVPKTPAENLKFRLKLLKRCERSKSERDLVLEACRVDPLFFISTFVYSHSPKFTNLFGSPVIPFIPFKRQQIAYKTAWMSVGVEDVLFEKSRQMGASWVCMLVYLHLWGFHRGMSLLMTSRRESLVDGSSKSLFSHVDRILKRVPPWMFGARGEDWDRRKLKLINHKLECDLDGESTTENIGVGEDRHGILLDEFPLYDNGGYPVLGATADVTNSRLFNGTPAGVACAYYEQRPRCKRVRLHWSSHPWRAYGLYRPAGTGYEIIDENFWSKWNRDGVLVDPDNPDKPYEFNVSPTRALENVRSPWYDYQCQRRSEHEIAVQLDIDYQGSDYPLFDSLKVNELIDQFCRPPQYALRIDFANPKNPKVRPDPRGSLLVWCELDQNGNPPQDRSYSVGADVSHGTGRSNSVLSVADDATGEKVAEFAVSNMDQAEFAKVSVAVCNMFYGARLIFEDQMALYAKNVLKELSYTNVYFHTVEKGVAPKRTRNPGFHTDHNSKRDLLLDYGHDLYTRAFLNPSREALRECLQYIWTVGGRAEHAKVASSDDPSLAGFGHGDRVIADALCAKLCRGRRIDDYEVQEGAPHVGSIEWLREKASKIGAKPRWVKGLRR